MDLNQETKKHNPNERTRQNSRERTKRNGDKQSTRYIVQNTGYKDLDELRGRIDELSEKFNREREYIKNQSEMKTTIIEMNTLEEINS